jgi:hypothetical protein
MFVEEARRCAMDRGEWINMHAIYNQWIEVVDSMHVKGIVSDEVKKNLKVSGSRFGIMYGLPKIHKKNVPLRPILSTIGTANYCLSKFLVSLLTPFVNNEFSIKDSFTFAQEICTVPNNHYVMASFDVVSLFTNIPVDETIDIILSKLFANDVKYFHGFDKKTFQTLLQNCTRDNIFLFNGDLYVQKDGAPMGGCVSPTLANIFLSHLEQQWMDDCPHLFKPVLYRRYVDDTFLLFRDERHIDLFLNYVNGKHASITFTTEIESKSRLNFLDITVEKNYDSFQTNLYRKKKNTGLGLRF